MIVFLRILAISVTWVVIQLTSGWIAHKLTSQQLITIARWFKIWSWEHGGNFYQKIWKIKTWKDKLPEAGAFFAGGVAKNTLARSDYQTILTFYYETIRAEFSHWLPWIFSWTFFLWNSADIAIWMPPIGLLGNLPFILIQRYNRARIEILLEKYPENLPRS